MVSSSGLDPQLVQLEVAMLKLLVQYWESDLVTSCLVPRASLAKLRLRT